MSDPSIQLAGSDCVAESELRERGQYPEKVRTDARLCASGAIGRMTLDLYRKRPER